MYLLLFFTYSHKFDEYSIAQLCFIFRSVVCDILKNCKWREQTLNFKCVAFRVWTRQRMFSKVFTSTTSMIVYVLHKMAHCQALQNCVFKETIGLSHSVFLENIIECKGKRIKIFSDLPLAIYWTVFDAIFHDVSATVRSYFNWDSHLLIWK